MDPKTYSIISPDSRTENAPKNVQKSSKSIVSIKLTDELVEKLMKGQKDLDNLTGVEFKMSSNQGSMDKLKIGSEIIQFMKVNEAQPVHILSTDPANEETLLLLGSVNQKLNPKLELEASKAEVIRQRSQEAEKERLARKTMELDAVLPVSRQKRSITRRPSVSSTSTSPALLSIRPSIASSTSSTTSLRTKTIQLLALGPQTLPQLSQKLGANLEQLKPVLMEVSTCSAAGTVDLRPEIYSQVKVTDWPHYSMRDREIVCKNVASHFKVPETSLILAQPIPRPASAAKSGNSSNNNFNLTPPETPETPSKRQFPTQITRTSAPSSAKKPTTAKDRLTAIMKKRKI